MIEMCYFYTTTGFPAFKPKCLAGLKASLRCHSINNCPAYMVVLDEYANYHYKDLYEMINSPEYQRFTKHIRQLVAEGKITIYPPYLPRK